MANGSSEALVPRYCMSLWEFECSQSCIVMAMPELSQQVCSPPPSRVPYGSTWEVHLISKSDTRNSHASQTISKIEIHIHKYQATRRSQSLSQGRPVPCRAKIWWIRAVPNIFVLCPHDPCRAKYPRRLRRGNAASLVFE